MLEDKIEALTTEVVALRKIMEKALPGLTGAAAKSSDDAEDKPAAKAPAKKPPAKAPAKKPAAKAKPKHTEDEVAAVMRQAAKDVDKAAIIEYIQEQGCDDLADLLTKPELYDAAFEFASGMLPEDEEEEEEDGDI